MFSAVVRQLSGEHSHYTADTLRQAVVKYLRENPYRDAERTCHYRDFIADAVATDDTYNADTEAPNEEDKFINSIEDPDERAELKWQKYLRRLQAGAYGDDMALTGVAELLSVAIHVTKTYTPLHIHTGIATSHIFLALLGQFHYVSLEPQQDDMPGSTGIEMPPPLPSNSSIDASGLQCNTGRARSEQKQGDVKRKVSSTLHVQCHVCTCTNMYNC